LTPASAPVPSPGSTPQSSTAQRQADLKRLTQILQLEITDRHVRAHEQAHLVAAGPYAVGGPSYSYTVGPDGNRYASGGEVSLDASPDPQGPEATIQKARIIQAAANAPVDPSSQDRMVAAQAARMEAAAERELSAEQQRYVQSAYQAQEMPGTSSAAG